MGWSCAARASDTERRISAWCRATTGSSNVFEVGGSRYFYEVGDETKSGAIVGEVFKMVGESSAEHACGFRIAPDGKFTHGPAAMKAAAAGGS